MRRLVWILVLVYTFSVPWEYSLDFGAPFGNIARIVGVLLVIAAVPTILMARQYRRPGLMQFLTLGLYLWFCVSFFWTVSPAATTVKLRGLPQEMMIVWLVWEFADSPLDVRNLMRVWLAGSWVLAILTIANFASSDFGSAEQIRFAAAGQDPNDVARFLDLGFPIAALLIDGKERWVGRLLAAGYLPVGLLGVLLTASRGGFLTALVAMSGSAVLLTSHFRIHMLWGAAALPGAAGAAWRLVPPETLARLASLPDQLRNGDLNQRINIWSAGWNVFLHAPAIGYGTGSFVTAVRLAPSDTAHNTALSILVEGGIIALFLATGIVVVAVRFVMAMRGRLRTGLGTLMAVWLVSSLVGTVTESRATWLLFGIIALCRRLAQDGAEPLDNQFACARHSAANIGAQ